MGEDVALAWHRQLQCTDDTGRLARAAACVVVAHPVHVERRLVVLREHALAEPLVEPAAGARVAVLARLVAREIDVHDVVRVTLL